MDNETVNHAKQHSIGTRLKKAREGLSLTILDVARQLRLKPDCIEALESDNYQNIPGKTFAKGYLRAYARLVNLPADEIIDTFEQLKVMPEVKFTPISKERPASLRNKPIRLSIYLVGFALLVLVIIWWNSLNNNDVSNLNVAHPLSPSASTSVAANPNPQAAVGPTATTSPSAAPSVTPSLPSKEPAAPPTHAPNPPGMGIVSSADSPVTSSAPKALHKQKSSRIAESESGAENETRTHQNYNTDSDTHEARAFLERRAMAMRHGRGYDSDETFE